MFDVQATAVRRDAEIEVSIFGYLPNPCHGARIADIYPGGQIRYFQDPGAAQVFIETFVIDPGPCIMRLEPWQGSVSIPDEHHREVQILVDGQAVATVPV